MNMNTMRARRGGVEENSMSVPMFPRLHINDTEQGGPKAPPRNKMALYEQMSMASSQNHGLGLVPSKSCVRESSILPPHLKPPIHHQKIHPRTSDVMCLTTKGGSKRKSFNQRHETFPVTEELLPSFDQYDSNIDSNSLVPHRNIQDKRLKRTNTTYLLQFSGRNMDKVACTNDLTESVGGVEGKEANKVISDDSMAGSFPGFGISPEDVIGVIGQKHFCQARRAMADQQRMFANQVFELHRLIKVQKYIAGSPHILLDAVPRAKDRKGAKDAKIEPTLTASTSKKVPRPQIPKSCAPVFQLQGISPQLPIQSHDQKGPDASSIGSFPKNTPQGNPWLVPVMSPTEGLVYKPYTGTFPPNGSFMHTLSCSINLSYGHPNSQIVPIHFPHHGMQVMKPQLVELSTSNQKRDVPQQRPQKLQPFKDPALRPIHFPHHGMQVMKPQLEESSISSQKRDVPQQRPQKLRPFKDPALRPIVPATSGSDLRADQGQTQISIKSSVIKVVPHIPKSANATESAARIFRSIQEERHKKKIPVS